MNLCNNKKKKQTNKKKKTNNKQQNHELKTMLELYTTYDYHSYTFILVIHRAFQTTASCAKKRTSGCSVIASSSRAPLNMRPSTSHSMTSTASHQIIRCSSTTNRLTTRLYNLQVYCCWTCLLPGRFGPFPFRPTFWDVTAQDVSAQDVSAQDVLAQLLFNLFTTVLYLFHYMTNI